MNEWNDPEVILPPVGKPVKCLLRWFDSGNEVLETLILVEEDDCLWRTADDKCEVTYSVTVEGWKEIK